MMMMNTKRAVLAQPHAAIFKNYFPNSTQRSILSQTCAYIWSLFSCSEVLMLVREPELTDAPSGECSELWAWLE